MSPLQVTLPATTGALTAKGLPQLSFTVGGVGATALAGQSTVEVPGAGIVAVGGSTVVVCTHVYVAPAQSV